MREHLSFMGTNQANAQNIISTSKISQYQPKLNSRYQTASLDTYQFAMPLDSIPTITLL